MNGTNLIANLPSINPTVDRVRNKAIDFAFANGPQIITAIVIIIIGLFLARWINHVLMRALNKKDMEPPVKMLISRIVRALVIGFALLVALGTAGVNVMALVAGISVAGVGVGLAAQGILSNMFAGLTIIFTKPFCVGDYVELAGVEGQVENIELLYVRLLHNDMSFVIIPNRKIVGEIFHNYRDMKQLDLSVNVAYGSDINQVLAIVKEVILKNPRVLKTPAPGAGVKVLGDGVISIGAKAWTKLGDGSPASAEIYQAINERFRAEKVALPTAYREVRFLNPPPVV